MKNIEENIYQNKMHKSKINNFNKLKNSEIELKCISTAIRKYKILVNCMDHSPHIN